MAALGYRPGFAQTAAVLTGIQLLAFAVPILGGMAAAAIALNLSIGHRRHALTVQQLITRRSAASGIERIARVDAGRG